MPSTSQIAVRLGTRWWESDSHELAKTDERSNGLVSYGCYLAAVAIVAVAMLANSSPCVATPGDFAAGRLSSSTLAVFRSLVTVAFLVVLIRRMVGTGTADEETLDRRPIKMTSHGHWRVQGLTQWQFMIIILYFGMSAFLTIRATTLDDDASQTWLVTPSHLSCVAETTLGVAFALALLTTVIVTFVLIPGKHKNGTSCVHFFGFDELVMHNANTLLLVIDLLAGSLSIRLTAFPYVLLIGVAYVSFHHFIRYPRTRTLLYFFLSWQHPKALPILLALLSAIGCFYLVGTLITESLRPTAWGPPLTLLATCTLMQIRNPRPDLP